MLYSICILFSDQSWSYMDFEQAKAFFANHSANLLYKLVMEGTQISSAQENYAKAKSIYTETSLKVKKFRSRMETKKSEVENVAKKLEQAIRDKVGSPLF